MIHKGSALMSWGTEASVALARGLELMSAVSIMLIHPSQRFMRLGLTKTNSFGRSTRSLPSRCADEWCTFAMRLCRCLWHADRSAPSELAKCVSVRLTKLNSVLIRSGP